MALSVLPARTVWIFFLIIGFGSLLHHEFLLNFASNISRPFHEFCLENIQANGAYREIYSALSCGQKLDVNSSVGQLVRKSGLIHLFVISGAHLVFLEHWVRKLGQKAWIPAMLEWPILLLFTLTSQINPPITRALIQIALKKLNLRFELNWNGPALCMGSGLICLCLFPEWWNSFSLQLSWLATLSLMIAARLKLWPPLVVYLLIMPLLGRLSYLHPVSILCNCFGAILFSLVLFPLSLIGSFLPFAHKAVDPLWTIFFQTLKIVPDNLAFQPFVPGLSQASSWVYIFSLQWIFLRLYQRARE